MIDEILEKLLTYQTLFLTEEVKQFIKNTDFIFNYKKQYFRLVRILTEETYKDFYTEINPKKLKRNWRRGFQLDHKFSISEGFKQRINPFIISSKFNLALISKKENKKKSAKCSITKEELLSLFYTKIDI